MSSGGSTSAVAGGGLADHWLPAAAVTASGRPALIAGEVERYLLPLADLEAEENPSLPPLRSCLVALTSHRLVFLHEQSASARAVPLVAVVHVFPPKSSNPIHTVFSTSHPRIRIQLYLPPNGAGGGRGLSVVVSIVMRGKGAEPDVFHRRLVEAVRAQAWEVASGQGSGHGSQPARAPLAISMPVVGVSGILRKEQEIWESTDRSMQEAFQDMNALMGKAKEMVQLAEKMRQKLLTTSNNDASGDDELASKQDMQDWLLSVGFISPVTKESAGALYHQQLSRQLADFVRVPLEKAGGMIALVDVYCLFNRARGTELISPEDLLQACSLWERIDVPVKLRTFDSGVKVIQVKSQSDDEVLSRLFSLAQQQEMLRKGISPGDAALTLGIAPALAKEHLLNAENKGLLCRDVSADGFRFYINYFNEIDPANFYRCRAGGFYEAWIAATNTATPV